MAKQTITKEINNWLKAKAWDERPVLQDDNVTSITSFRYAAGGEYGLNCSLIASEDDSGMITLVATPDFVIAEGSIDEVRKFCSHFRKEYGNFYVMDDGNINYIHSRSIDSYTNGLSDVAAEVENMINEMDEYIARLALSIVDVANGNSAIKAIEDLEMTKEK